MNTTDPAAIPASYLDTIRASDPTLPLDTLTLNQEGIVNDVVVAADRVVFRFPKAPWATDALAHEIRVLDLVRDRIGVRVPAFTPLPGGSVRYALIPGEPLTRDLLHALPPPARERLLAQLGGVLTALHTLPAADLAAAGVDWPSLATHSRADWLTFFDRVEAVLFPHLFRYQRDWVTARFTPVRNQTLDLEFDPVLIHGDLAPYHLLVDPALPALAGLIDFGVAGLGDPAVDVASLLYSLGEPTLAQLLRAYPSLAPPPTLARAHFWATTFELQWALTGLERNDHALLLAHIGT